MLQVNVEPDFQFDLQENNNQLELNGKDINWEISDLKDGKFHILVNHVSYRAEVMDANFDTKICTIKINNNIYNLQLKDKFDLLLDKLGINAGAAAKVNEIKAPMPGLVLNVMVGEGDVIQKDDSVLVLEAMKMENVLKSPGDGVIKSINVKSGEAVEKNQVLVILE